MNWMLNIEPSLPTDLDDVACLPEPKSYLSESGHQGFPPESVCKDCVWHHLDYIVAPDHLPFIKSGQVSEVAAAQESFAESLHSSHQRSLMKLCSFIQSATAKEGVYHWQS